MTASFSNCCFMRGPIFWRVTGPQKVDLPAGVQGSTSSSCASGLMGRLDGGVQISHPKMDGRRR